MAEVEHLDALAGLLDAYRVFYGQPSNRPAARHFLFERMINHESVIWLARDKNSGEALGFVQLYPTFSSVALAPVWILNDLFVAPAGRRQGIGKALVLEAINLVRERGDYGLILETAPDNVPAQKLYLSLGFERDQAFQHYCFRI